MTYVPKRLRQASSALAITALALSALLAGPASHAEPPQEAPAASPLSSPVDLAGWYDGLAKRYRTPGLAVAPNGDLLAVFDSRPGMDDLPSNIATVMRRSTDGGATWGPIQTIRGEAAPNGYGDPSILVDRVLGRVFVFTAASVNQGYGGSSTSSANDDPDVLHLDVSYSDDNGQTWAHRRLTKDIKQPGWGGVFASSGEGIQLRHGPHAGRLLQQLVVRSAGQNYAVTLYSDDHGESWSTSELVGPRADENKVVELSDGSVMLTSRQAGSRWQAISHDGGQTYSDPVNDPQLVDPGSNGTMTRLYPEAQAPDPRASMLVSVNAEDPSIRRNLTAKISCDDGATWPGEVTIDPQSSAYISATPLGSGRMGLIYERAGYSTISYRTLDVSAAGMVCAPVTREGDAELTAGERSEVELTISNQTGADLQPGSLALAWPQDASTNAGSVIGTVEVPGIPAAGAAKVVVPATAPAGTAGPAMLDATYTVSGSTSHAIVNAEVARPADAAEAPALTVEPYIDAIYTDSDDTVLGDRAVAWVRVRNSGNTPLNGIRVTSSTNEPGCQIASLDPGATQVCRDRRQMGHVITAADVQAGSWSPTYTATASAGNQAVTATAELSPLALGPISPAPDGGSVVSLPTGDFQSSSFIRVGQGRQPGFTLPDGHPLSALLALGGRTSGQLSVAPASDGVVEAEVRPTGDTAQAGAQAPTWTVRYPMTIPKVSKPSPEAPAQTTGVVEDPLSTTPPSVRAGTNQSLWFTLEAAAGTPAGTYTYEVAVKVAGKVVGTYPATVNVSRARLAPPAERDFMLDLWYHPDAVADLTGTKLWSPEHFAALQPYLDELGRAGQRVVNTAVVEDPWLVRHKGQVRPQTHSHYGSTVEWRWDGSAWSFDFTSFDKVVEAHERAGITGEIHAFAMLQFRLDERLVFTDTRTGAKTEETVTLGSQRYNEAWGAFLNAFADHLRSRGWFERTSLAFDERPADLMNQVYGIIHTVSPQWDGKTALAANSLAEADIAPYISFNYEFLAQVPDSLIAARKAKGEPTLFYTYYSPERPNVVVASPPQSARAMGWVAAKRDLDGILRWSFNSWPADVLSDPVFMYGQGDEYLVYPGQDGPMSSIRWETFLDGIDDFAVLALARQEAAGSPELARVLSLVQDDAALSPNAWSAMVTARAEALELASPPSSDKVTARVSASRTQVDPATPADLTVRVSAPTDAATTALTITPVLPKGWKVLPGAVKTNPLPAGGSARASFRVLPETGPGQAEIGFEVSDADGTVLATTSLTLTAAACAPVKPVAYAADSAETEANESPGNGVVSAAFDNNPATYWHTRWSPSEDTPPHWVTMDLGQSRELCAVTYLPRQGRLNGRIKTARVYVSDAQEPGEGDWGAAVAEVSIPQGEELQTIELASGARGRHVKLEAVEMHPSQSGQPRPNFSSAAEIGVLGAPEPATLTEPTQPEGSTAVTPPGPGTDPEPEPEPDPGQPEGTMPAYVAAVVAGGSGQVLVGDWDGDGALSYAVRVGSRVVFYNDNHTGAPVYAAVSIGRAGDEVLVGDWDGDGRDTLALRRGAKVMTQDVLTSTRTTKVVVEGLTRSSTLKVVPGQAGAPDTLVVG